MANENKDLIESQEETEKPTKKKFTPTELIPCVSITPGEMFVHGNKSNTLYTFADIDDCVMIKFKDLDYAARIKDKMMFKPRYIVQDADFIKLHPSLDEVYSALHTTKDLKDILKMKPAQMEKVIPTLPVGAKEALKTLASTAVDDGSLDSIKKIQKLDSILGTELFLRLNL